MSFNFNMEEWHGIFVVTGKEDKVKERLKFRLQNGFTAMVPKRIIKLRKGGLWKTETKVLFPGYVLFNGRIDTDTYYQMKNIPDILKLLRTGNSIASIDSREMAILSRLICNSEEIGISNVIMENGKVRVIDGPLFSLEGIIVSVDRRKERARVKLSFLGEERIVDLGISCLAPVQ